MPNINDINGVTVANLAKLDAVLKANISKVNGLTLAAAFTGLLDTYTGADFGFSVRLLSSSYTGAAMRVIRYTAGGTGDADEADISFVNNLISLDSAISNASAGVTATTLGQFINVGTVGGTTYTNPDSLTTTATAGLVKWYDQSGNGLDLTADSALLLGYIHDGTVNTDINKENGVAIVKVNVTAVMTSGTYSYGTTNTVFSAIKNFTTADSTLLRYPSGVLGYSTSGSTSSADFGFGTTSYYQNGSEFQSSSPTRGDMYTATQNQSLFSILFGNPSSATYLRIGRIGAAAMYSTHELIGYPNQTVSRTGVETNINSEYLIYQPTDAPTSGLLYDYGSATGGTDAAAAYSVRQLSDKAVIAMRIRRDSDDEERNIGFDSNGDLDTTAISDFCDTANGYVVEWADQSTNGNHASQSTGTSQPQIYNGTAVITENSKPALDFDGTNALSISVTGTVTNFTAFFVRGFATYPNTFQNGFHYKARGIGYNQAGGTGYRIAHLINGTSSVQRADSYPTTTGQALDYFLNQSELYRNSASQTLQSGSTYGANTTSVIGGWQESSQNITATIQELIIYESDESSNRTGIETDINGYFSIY